MMKESSFSIHKSVFCTQNNTLFQEKWGILTNFSGHGKSNSFTIPKSSPVTMLRPEWDTQVLVTSALSVFLDQIPTTSSPRTLQRHPNTSTLQYYSSHWEQSLYWHNWISFLFYGMPAVLEPPTVTQKLYNKGTPGSKTRNLAWVGK